MKVHSITIYLLRKWNLKDIRQYTTAANAYVIVFQNIPTSK